MGRLVLILICSLSIFSCKEETSLNVVGVWESSSLILDKSIDLNGDRSITRNIYEESKCAFERITFRADNSVTIENNKLGMGDCDDVNVIEGTWAYTNEANTATLIMTLDVDGLSVIDTVQILDNVTIRCYHPNLANPNNGVTVTYKDQKRR